MQFDVGDMRIDILKDGPCKVSGSVPLVRVQITVDENGDAVGFRETHRYPEKERYLLCRCGQSQNKPFCDGAHIAAGYRDDTTAREMARFTDNAEGISGDGIELLDANTFCIGARFCDRAGSVWNLTESSGRNPAFKETAITESKLCPSGRLVMIDTETREVLEPTLEPSIALIEDPSRGVSSALWVRGGIPVYDHEGNQIELRNRVTICRCGASANKPFCDGHHYTTRFDDGHVED